MLALVGRYCFNLCSSLKNSGDFIYPNLHLCFSNTGAVALYKKSVAICIFDTAITLSFETTCRHI